MKLQAPENCGGATVNGEPVHLDDKGQCEVSSAESVAALMSHGFVEVKEESKKPRLQGKGNG